MTLADALDRLADDATADIVLFMPSKRQQRAARRPHGRSTRLALIVPVLVGAVVAALVISHDVAPDRHTKLTSIPPVSLTAEPGASQLLVAHPGIYVLSGPVDPNGHLGVALAISPDLACVADWNLDGTATTVSHGTATFRISVRRVRRPAVAAYRVQLSRLASLVPLGGSDALRASAQCRPPLPPPAPVRGTPPVDKAHAVAAVLGRAPLLDPTIVSVRLVSRSDLYAVVPSAAPREAESVDSDRPDTSPVWAVLITGHYLDRSDVPYMLVTVDADPPDRTALVVQPRTEGIGPVPAPLRQLTGG